jgi:hypothetical protein
VAVEHGEETAQCLWFLYDLVISHGTRYLGMNKKCLELDLKTYDPEELIGEKIRR